MLRCSGHDSSGERISDELLKATVNYTDQAWSEQWGELRVATALKSSTGRMLEANGHDENSREVGDVAGNGEMRIGYDTKMCTCELEVKRERNRWYRHASRSR